MMASSATTTIISTRVNPLTRVIRYPPFSVCTICWPSDKMEFIAMTGCLSGTKRSFGNFLRDFKGVGAAGADGRCSHPGRVLLRSGGEFGFMVGALPDRRTARVRRGGLEFAPGAGAPTVGRVLVSAFDQSRSSRVTVMSWRATSTIQKV